MTEFLSRSAARSRGTRYEPVSIGSRSVADEHRRLIRQLCKAWSCPDLAAQVQISYSSRLTRSLGLAYPDRNLIRLNLVLREAPESVRDAVLCHELAHLAVHRRHGRKAKPHGCEWRALVRAAGFEPRVTFSSLNGWRPRARRFRHFCPACQHARVARKPMRRWRCATCVEAGLQGRLIIEELATR